MIVGSRSPDTSLSLECAWLYKLKFYRLGLLLNGLLNIHFSFNSRLRQLEHSPYIIFIDGRWSLEDLYVFPRAYEQVYFVLEALSPYEQQEAEERIQRAFSALPWRGGYSTVAFYNQLRYATPRRFRPEIRAIQYASPGYIDLLLNLPQAVQVAGVVSSVAGAIVTINKAYSDIYTGLQKRELLRIEIERKKIKLEREQLRFIQESADTMAKILGLKSIQSLNERTNDPLISLKILLSAYRRVRTLAEYVNQGKASFVEERHPNRPKSRNDRS